MRKFFAAFSMLVLLFMVITMLFAVTPVSAYQCGIGLFEAIDSGSGDVSTCVVTDAGSILNASRWDQRNLVNYKTYFEDIMSQADVVAGIAYGYGACGKHTEVVPILCC